MTTKTFTIERFDELWDAILAKVEVIERAHKRSGSRSTGRTDGREVSTILDITMPDGTCRVFHIRAYVDMRKEIVTQVDRWYHNNEPYWEMIIESHSEDKRVIIDGVHYVLGKNGDAPSPHNGFGGRRHVIDFFDGRHIITHDLWYQGPIPPVFRDQLPDNATWGPSDSEIGV